MSKGRKNRVLVAFNKKGYVKLVPLQYRSSPVPPSLEGCRKIPVPGDAEGSPTLCSCRLSLLCPNCDGNFFCNLQRLLQLC